MDQERATAAGPCEILRDNHFLLVFAASAVQRISPLMDFDCVS